MTGMEWVAIFGAITGGIALVIAIQRYFREAWADPHIAWVSVLKEIDSGTLGTDVRLMICVLGAVVGQPPLARAEWPEEKPTLTLGISVPFAVSNPGLVYMRIIWRSTSRPRERWEEWFPVTLFGETAEILRKQTVRSPLRVWLLRLRGAGVGPTEDGLPRRRVTNRDIRRELRKAS